MTGFLDRLAAYLQGEAPAVAVRPRGPFEPEAGPGPDPWPAAGTIGADGDAGQEPGRHAASVPRSGSVPGLADTGPSGTGLSGTGLSGTGLSGTGLSGTGPVDIGPADIGPADRGPGGSHAANADDPGPIDSHPGNADGPAPASPPPAARSRTARPAGRRPPDGPARPAAMPDWLLPPDEEPALPAGPRSRQAPVPARGAAAAGPQLVPGGADGAGRRSEDGARVPVSGAAGPGGAARAAPTVVLKNSSGSLAPAAEPGSEPAQPDPPSLDELLARHVVPALRAAGAVRSGRDTVRLTQEPVTEHRGGDVHVHLGRIEVVQPPSAAPDRAARSRPRPPAPDHEAYLARRREGRR